MSSSNVPGERRGNAAKRAAVDALLGDPGSRSLSNRALARRCGVSHELVARRRRASGNGSQIGETRIAERRGKQYAIRIGARATRRTQGKAACGPGVHDQMQQPLLGDAGLTYRLWAERLGRIVAAANVIVSQWRATQADLARLHREGKLTEGRLRGMQGVMAGVAGLMRFHVEALERSLPFAVCPFCGGVQVGCPGCGGVGWVDRGRYEAAMRRSRRR